MAGESPDKTEQRKSSGTAAEERDPRFAVFREPGADGPGADAAGADAAEGVAADEVTSDTATAVFRPRLPEDEAGRRTSEVSAEAPAGEPAGESAPAEGESESGSAEDKPGSRSAEKEPASAGKPASRETEPASAEEEPAQAPEGAVTPQKPAEDPEHPESPDVTAEAPESDAADTADAAADEAESDEPEPGDVRLRAAVTAWVDAAAEGEGDGEGKGEAGAKPESGGEPEPADEPGAVEEPEAKEPEAAGKSVAAGKPESAADPEPDSERDPEPDSGADEAPGPAAETGDDLRGTDQPTAVFKAPAPAKRVDRPTTALKLSPQELQELQAAGDKPQKDELEKDKPEKDEPESAVERTSTFVPLRSDDVRPAPAPRAPETEASTGKPDTDAATPAAAPAPAAPSWAAAERTRQQPLPPKPPLDLLAELTNTPPPAETPVRTAVRRVKIWTPLVLLLLIVFAIVQVMRPLPEPSLELTAEPAYTFEGGETKLSWPGQGQSAVLVDGVGSLGSEGAQKPAPIASVAKVMTAYVILEGHPLKGDEQGETITVDQKAEDESKRPDESTAPLTKGQQLTQRQMLQLLMIPSGNNAARLLARWDAGGEDKFIDKMNDAAKDLGMTNSTYTDPSGLEKTTVSTAADQLKLAQAVMENDVFREIVDMPEVEIEGIDGKIYNNNTLLLQDGVSGIKTGSSTPAGGNLLWSANTKVDGKVLWIYGAVMGQQAGTGRVYDSLELSLQNSLKLIKDAQKAPTSATVVKKGDVVGYVDNGFGAQTPVIATKNLKAVGWPGLEVELKVTDSGKGIAHSAKAGSEVGMVTVGTGTGKVTAPVVLQDDLTEPAFGDKLTRIG
ncbi:serine hydrolase [Streptomyces sp. NPDC059513]|uniref:D-alanyl-D-alanine carboxypeptidase n=1 Tax=unclassified Streptomyces TaxID=2593676 RepID=UPI0036975D40